MGVLDILDAHIAQMDPHALREAALSQYKKNFILFPGLFTTTQQLPALEWNSFEFNTANPNLPDQQGVYAFSVNFRHANLPSNSYILYVGKAGDVDSRNTIQARFRDYRREKSHMTRATIHSMLNLWDGHLTYHYACVENGTSTGDIEKVLTGIFMPPYNTNDFHAELRPIRRGVNI
ncbi:hypothetical protein J4G66_06485 [Aeromonas dhakensis]|uniref:hypothetical protein n=1 Tax=Aeromonas dhakensis TaxID=196024 RepID=UPI001BCDE62E|nr:hypothetical protein [Aeromonas dhakensis]MBS4715619.1 hypothetical protein [Aeromonas dhakensis]